MAMPGTRAPEAPLALHRPGPARVHDYLLGGKDNYAADRDLAQRILRVLPQAADGARTARGFLAGAVRLLARRGVRQFIDLGCGLPRADNLHQMAARHTGGTRVVYVDHDPLVIAHARALLIDGGNIAALQADLRAPDAILGSAEVRRLIDPAEPVALVFSSVLHFLPGAGDLVAGLAGTAPPGSALVVSHLTADFAPAAVAEAARLYREASTVPVHPRDGAEIARLLGPFRPLPPGVTPLGAGGAAGDPIVYGVVGVR
ncbi:SAM-dependent methyltransferase [Actinomadura darangshiensis]|uniref:SAM-dependent methyltransferase n=1 Tax=Actinomadura darangshiensis TaxID=705336 RepID=A0A4R5BKK9_9ACTN|nr:SAM-dependent methyltransferase [Actinomadura darangshiensis]TDD85746.1 SAM-dependent methyltransferase [Actinomadura darangshiensis]